MRQHFIVFALCAGIASAADGMPPDWVVRNAVPGEVSCLAENGKNLIRINSPRGTVLMTRQEKVPLSEFSTVKVRADFKGKGTIRAGFHCYGKNNYCGTFPWRGRELDTGGKFIRVQTVQKLGRYSDGFTPADKLPAYGLLCIYAGPGTEGVLTNFSMEVSPDPPDTTSPIADPEPRPGVPPLQHRLVMSGTIYAVEGVETNVYFRNIFLAVNPDLYLFDVDCSKGHNFKNRWSFTPGKKDVGIHDWTLRVRNNSGIVAKKSFKLAVAPADAGKGKNISLLMVGDSITDVTTFPKRVRELFKKPGNPALTMVGTRPSPAKNGSMAHEGYAGWAWSTFLEKGPFIDPASGKLDVESYFKRVCGGRAPDFITIQLGVNDVFGSDDFRIYHTIERISRNMDELVGAFVKAAPNAVIGIGLPTPGASQDGIGRVYRCRQTRYQYDRNRFMLSDMVMRKYGNGQCRNVKIIPMYHNLDCENNFPMAEYPVNSGNPVKIPMPSDGLHPAPSGGNQLGDTLYAWLKYCLHKGKTSHSNEGKAAR